VDGVSERVHGSVNADRLVRALWWCADRYETVTTRLIAARGLAVLRIGYGTLWVLFLLREWGERDAMWGPGSAWSPDVDRQYAAATSWSGVIRAWMTAVAGFTPTEFDLFYVGAIAVGVAFALGWYTRVVSILFAVMVVALENRSPMLTDGGDNVMTLMSVYLAFTACGTHWSLDARRRAAKAPKPPRTDWRGELAEAWRRMLTVAHNGAVLVVAAQICVIYGTAGFLKVQGSMWQDGSALGYVLQLNWFHPWPGLSAWLAGHAITLAVAGYVTVFVQAGFPFIVFAPRLKYPAIAVLVAMHLSIAVLLGLPFFSTIMIVGDAVFLPDRFWAAAAHRLAGPAYAQSVPHGMPRDVHSVNVHSVAAVRPTLVFDGDCAFCTASVDWMKRWCRPAVRFVPWQHLELAAHGLTEEQVTTAVQWLAVADDAPVRSGAAAVARVLLRSRWPWRPVGALMLIPPISWLAALGYRIVAANRHRLPGSTPACARPDENSARSLDSTQGLGDFSGGADDAGASAGRVEFAERDHAD
jgi:predicted DCC family thiol-disulfide oxidoreductase YuxK